MKFEVEVRGKLEEALERFLPILRSKIMKALQEATIEAYAEAKAKVPVRTGLLYSSIHIEKISPFEHKVVAGHPIKEKGKPYYAPFVEFGTRRMAPRPYMRPAADKAIQKLKELL